MKNKITYLVSRLKKNGGHTIFLKYLIKYFKEDFIFENILCLDKNNFDYNYSKTFSIPVDVCQDKEETEKKINYFSKKGNIFILTGDCNLNNLNILKPRLCLFNCCSEDLYQIDNSSKYIDHIIFCNNFLKNIYWKIPGTTIYPGISNKRFKFSHLVREKFKIKNKFVVGMVGRIDNLKNQYILAEAISQMGDNFIGFFIGDGIFKKNLKKQFKNCIFVGDIKNNLSGYYNSLDCYCNLSYSEGCSASVFEAMYFGLPIITTKTGFFCDTKYKNFFYLTIDNYIIQNLKDYINYLHFVYYNKFYYYNIQKEKSKEIYFKYGNIEITVLQWQNLIRDLI